MIAHAVVFHLARLSLLIVFARCSIEQSIVKVMYIQWLKAVVVTSVHLCGRPLSS